VSRANKANRIRGTLRDGFRDRIFRTTMLFALRQFSIGGRHYLLVAGSHRGGVLFDGPMPLTSLVKNLTQNEGKYPLITLYLQT
jgi:hypothetical protein